MSVSNQANIDEWSEYSQEEIESFGDDGDIARQQLLNPAIFKLIGDDLKGKKVLDAGSGTGYLSRKLAKLGAKVVGVEPAKNLYTYASERENCENLGIIFIQEDLSTFNRYQNYFDLVISNMVFQDIPDFKSAMTNCVYALKPGGILVFSISHPCFPGSETEWQEKGYVEIKEYFNCEPGKQKYGFAFERPLQSYFNCLSDLNCLTENLIEPQMPKDYLQEDPNQNRNSHVPQFIVFKCRKS